MSHYTAPLPAQAAAGATSLTTVGTVETTNDGGAQYLAAVTLTPPAGFTTVNGQATNNVTFNVRQYRAGVLQGTVATLQLVAGVSLAANTPRDVPVAGLSIGVRRGDVFEVQMVQNGTGLAVGAGVQAQVEIN